MKLSKRAAGITPSATLAITAKAKAMKAAGEKVIGFGAGEPDFDTPDHIKNAAVEALKKGVTKYTPAAGTPELKKAVVEKFKRENNLAYEADQIAVSCGAKHSLYNVFQVILDPGDEVIFAAPYWVSYPEMIKLADGVPVIVETEEEENWALTAERISKAVTSKTKAILINSPSNPTGAVLDKAVLEEIVALAEEKDLWIVSDEIYEHLLYDGRTHISPAQLSKKAKARTILVNGASKAYSMTGWRIGYTAGPKDVIKAIAGLQSHSTSNPTSFAQTGTVEALNNIAVTLEAMREMTSAFARRRKLIVDLLNEIDGVSCRLPDGAFYAFPNFKGVLGRTVAGKKVTTTMELTEALLEGVKVAVVPGEAFGVEGYLRLSYATSDENIKAGVARIKEAVEG